MPLESMFDHLKTMEVIFSVMFGVIMILSLMFAMYYKSNKQFVSTQKGYRMLKSLLIAAALVFIVSISNSFGQGKELSVETLVSILKSLGIYADNRVPIGGQYYLLKNVSIDKGRGPDDFVIRFTAKPVD